MTRYERLLLGMLLTLGGPALAWADTDRLQVSASRYDQEYPFVQYSGPARANRIWRLQQKLDSGEVRLQWEPRWGYLRSLLRALEIDISSQTLVFSKTSLQIAHIGESTPRAIYFNDDTYVGFVQNSDLLEFAAIDANVGVVFFGMVNRQDTKPLLDREGGRCLTCHDTYSMMGGGVPRVLVMSSPVDDASDKRTYSSASEVDDRTPVAERWGGWYLSGWYLPGPDGKPVSHLGNLALRAEGSTDTEAGAQLRALAGTRDNRGNLKGYFDTSAFLADKSDVVALLVLEHQTFVQNLITRTNYKAGMVMSRGNRNSQAAPRTWAALDARDQAALKSIMEPLVRALFFADAVPLPGQVVTSSGYTEKFAHRGPQDAAGRSLRDLQLEHRLFRYPLSYMVYSESFNALPAYALDYLDARLADVLAGNDRSGIADNLTADDRKAIGQILVETLPRFAHKQGAKLAAVR
ncbi:MAG: hypothetical protein ABIP38_14815 [Steroidobacteraceae bacterium]